MNCFRFLAAAIESCKRCCSSCLANARESSISFCRFFANAAAIFNESLIRCCSFCLTTLIESCACCHLFLASACASAIESCIPLWYFLVVAIESSKCRCFSLAIESIILVESVTVLCLLRR